MFSCSDCGTQGTRNEKALGCCRIHLLYDLSHNRLFSHRSIEDFGGREGLESLTLNELTLLYNNLNTEVADQKAYLRELEFRIEQYSSIAGGKERILKNMTNEIEKLKILSGIASVEGRNRS